MILFCEHQIASDSDIQLDSTGSFQHFDSVDRDWTPQADSASSTVAPDIPLQPLRPAPSPVPPPSSPSPKTMESPPSSVEIQPSLSTNPFVSKINNKKSFYYLMLWTPDLFYWNFRALPFTFGLILYLDYSMVIIVWQTQESFTAQYLLFNSAHTSIKFGTFCPTLVVTISIMFESRANG